MLRTRFLRSFAALASAILIASCSDSIGTNPTAPVDAVASHNSGSDNSGSLKGAVSDLTQPELRALWWKKHHGNSVRVSQIISPSGGTISIPQTGLTMVFPPDAVASPITITITADDAYVAYKMEPSGTQFSKDVEVTQLLGTTELAGRPLRDELYAAFINDQVKLSGKVPVLEIETGHTVFDTLRGVLVPRAHVWFIRHFSRYMLASG